jgi:hypothetical protein
VSNPPERTPTDCPKRDSLVRDVSLALSNIVNITHQHIQVLCGDDEAALIRLDRELENALDEKERLLSALHKHRKQHGC